MCAREGVSLVGYDATLCGDELKPREVDGSVFVLAIEDSGGCARTWDRVLYLLDDTVHRALHVLSHRAARAGAAACKHCGGAGGGSEWAKAFAAALCEAFDCPASVRLEALGLVLSAVTVAPSMSSTTLPLPDEPLDLDNHGGQNCPDPELGVAAVLGSGGVPDDGDGCPSDEGDSESVTLGGSWESVSSFAGLDIEEGRGEDGDGGPPDFGLSATKGGNFDDDDEAVQKGIWFPPPVPPGDAPHADEHEPRPAFAAVPALADGHSCRFTGSGNDTDREDSSERGGQRSAQALAEGSPASAGDRHAEERRGFTGNIEGVAGRRRIEDENEQEEGDAGSEFVLLVSREATVKELATRVGGFPKDWLEEAFGLVVRRQVEGAMYDARARAALKHAVRMLDGRVSWRQVAATEHELAALALDHDGRIQDGDKVGLAAAGGGVLLFLSGGVAAPSVTASLSAVGFAAANSVSSVAPTLGAWLGYTSASAVAAAAAATTSVGTFSAVSGVTGAGVAGYKMTRRTAGVQEFHFLPLHSKWPLDAPESMFEGASEPGLPVFICVPGWHEPGHDPRHTWGGVATRGTTPEKPRSKKPRSISFETVAVAEEGVHVTAPAELPTAERHKRTSARQDEHEDMTTFTRQSLRAAVAGGSAVSRWFTNGYYLYSGVESGGSREGLSSASSPAAVAYSVQGTVDGAFHEAEWGMVNGAAKETVDGTIDGTVNGTVCNTIDGTICEAFSARNDGGGEYTASLEAAAAAADAEPSRDDLASSSFVVLGAGGRGTERNGVVGGVLRDGDNVKLSSSTPMLDDGTHPSAGDVIGRQQEKQQQLEDMEAGDGLDDSWEALPSHAWWRDFVTGGEEHVLVWERGPLTELYTAIRDLAWKSASRRAMKQALKRSALAPVVAAAALPLALLEAASGLDDPWGVVRGRALEAGKLLAAVLLSRPVGSRPVTLLGYSMGAKVVFNCLEALAAAPGNRGLGIVENAVMLGTPVGTKRGRWKRARSAVAGRLINGYSSRDWLLALVYRSKSWSVGVAGTSRVEGCGVENVDLSGLVTWHLSYSRILPVVMAMLRLED